MAPKKSSDKPGRQSAPSWTDETLPLAFRRQLLDEALEDIKAAKAAGQRRTRGNAPQERAGRSGSSSRRSPPDRKDKPGN